MFTSKLMRVSSRLTCSVGDVVMLDDGCVGQVMLNVSVDDERGQLPRRPKAELFDLGWLVSFSRYLDYLVDARRDSARFLWPRGEVLI